MVYGPINIRVIIMLITVDDSADKRANYTHKMKM